MTNFQISTPIIIYFIRLLSENNSLLNNYVYRILFVLGIFSPVRLIVSIVIQPIIGIEYQQHYREIYPELKSYLASHNIELYGADKIHEFVSKIKSRMCAWKLLLFQAKLLREHWPHLSTCVNDNKAKNKNENVLDIDVTTLQSSSSKKEGAEPGYNKKSKGKPCYQLSASFIGKIFVDGKLFPGHCNPKNFFQKAVKRAISLGLNFRIVRGDTAYGSFDNLLFLTELCLGYTLGNIQILFSGERGNSLFQNISQKKIFRDYFSGQRNLNLGCWLFYV